MKSNKGFSLIEMMITVAILGILAAIAVPAYQGYVSNGRCQQVVAPVHSVMVDLVGDFAENGPTTTNKTSDGYKNSLTINNRPLTMPEDVTVKFTRDTTSGSPTYNLYTVEGKHANGGSVCKNKTYKLVENAMEGVWE